MTRLERLRELLAEHELDALLVGDLVRPGDSGPDAMASIRWLTGFTGTSGLAVVSAAGAVFLTDFRYEERARQEVGEEFERVIFTGELWPELAAQLEGRVGFDEAATSVRSRRKLAEALEAGAELVPVSGLVERLRRRKDAEEIARIAAASRLADEVLELMCERGVIGRAEREVAQWIEAAMRERGAEPCFPPIVGSGPNGALPHSEPGERVITGGDLVVVDLGAKLDGYCSDGTRTFAAGEPGEQEREVYELVRRAQEAGLAALRAGVEGAAADAAARAVIEQAGHGERFGHGLGHGVGLEVHEAPRLSKRSDDVLEAGDVVTVEPGVYLPGRFGIRIEDLVVVEDEGIRNLSTTSKHLRTLS